MADRVRYVNTASSGGDGTTNGESGGTAAFASLSAAEAAIQTEDSDLANGKVTIYCGVGSGSAADTTQVTVAGFTNPSSSNYIIIQANPTDTGGDQRAQVPWSDTIYRLAISSGSSIAGLDLQVNYTRLLNLQVRFTQTTKTSFSNVLRLTGTNCLVDGCYLDGVTNFASDDGGASYPLRILAGATSCVVRNTVGEERQTGSKSSAQGFLVQENATLQNCTYRMQESDIYQVWIGYQVNGAGKTGTFTNCLADCGSPTVSAPSGTSACFRAVAGSLGGDYNASNDATAPGGNSLTSVTFKFAATTDHRLRNASPGVQQGSDLSGSFTEDFNGVDRSAQTGYDIGAFQIVDAQVGQVYVNTASSGGNGMSNAESGTDAAYASLSAAEAGEQANLTQFGQPVYINCGVGSGSAADTTAVTVAGWTVDSGDYLVIQANDSDTGGDQRAVMPWSTSIYRLDMLYASTGAQSMCIASTAYTRWINLQIGSRNTSTGGAVTNINANAAGNQLFDSCLLRVQYDNASNSTTSSSTCLLLGANSEARNGVAYSENLQAGQHNGFIGFSTIQSGALYQNCTARMYGGRTFQAAYNEAATPDPTANNCLADTDGLATTDICFASYSGDYNASSDATAPGANSITSATFTFVDAANGDYHIDDDDSSGIKTGGNDLSGTFTVDFDNVTRVDWSIGADEYIAAAAGGIHELTQTISVSTFSVGLIIVQPVDTDS